MSLEDYARHMTHKYRLALSIAVLNTKPENLSIDEYLEEIKNNIIKKNLNMDDDFQISACSDDFKMDSFGENGSEYMNQNRLSHDLNTSQSDKDSSIVNKTRNDERQDETLFNDNEVQFNDMETQANDVNKERREKFREVIQVLKGVGVISMDQVMVDETRRDFDSLPAKPFDPMDLDLTQCYEENYSTLSRTIDKLTNIDKGGSKETCSEKLETNKLKQDVPKQITKDISTIASQSSNTATNYSQSDKIKELKAEIKRKMNNNENVVTVNSKIAKMKTKDHTKTETNNVNNARNSLEATRHKDESHASTFNVITTDQTHYSQSQINEVFIDKRFVHSKINNNITKVNEKEHFGKFNVFLNYEENFNRENRHSTDENRNESLTLFDTHIQYLNDESQRQNLIENDTALPKDIVDASLEKSRNENSGYFIDQATYSQNQNVTQNDSFLNPYSPNDRFFYSNSQNDRFFNPNSLQADAFDQRTDEDCVVFDKNTEYNSINTENYRNELIPFKILEEMKRIKVYLKRKESQSCSSGYKSLQSFGTLGSTQSENQTMIEQSAYSVFNYLTTCSLVNTTRTLTEEISEVLGKLIDKLHEDEIYPPFLEELLNTIKDTLKLVYEEENYVFDVLLNKDEQIQRILLLSKSMHIQKFTIENINNILQKLPDDILLDNTISEINNINKIENLNYIFHILEIILPKYCVNYTQSTQKPQNEEFKKKYISEVWRKKWVVHKEIPKKGRSETKCVLKECSDILNKIIVTAIDGYSLVSFAALQCFNLLQ